MQSQERFIDFNGYKTWVGMYGDFGSGKIPLLAIHGGPGFPHYHLQNLSELADRGIPVVMYDQLGCGKSDRPDNPELWTTELFVSEVAAVREALGLDTVYLLGHSWGGSLAVEYLLTEPTGVQKLILSSPLLDTKLWIEETDKLRDQLPDGVADTMREHEAAGTTVSEQYQKAVDVFNNHFLCRRQPWPAELQQTFDEGNVQVYETMWGPSEVHATGVLKDWSVLNRLHEIGLPTLLISGRYDEATPRQMKEAQKALPNSERVLLENSAHITNYEEPEKYLKAVEVFLKQK